MSFTGFGRIFAPKFDPNIRRHSRKSNNAVFPAFQQDSPVTE
jgi:hypothetical protein